MLLSLILTVCVTFIGMTHAIISPDVCADVACLKGNAAAIKLCHSQMSTIDTAGTTFVTKQSAITAELSDPITSAETTSSTEAPAPTSCGRQQARELIVENEALASIARLTGSKLATTCACLTNDTSPSSKSASAEHLNLRDAGFSYNQVWGPQSGCEDLSSSNAWQIDASVSQDQYNEALAQCVYFCAADSNCHAFFMQWMFPFYQEGVNGFWKCYINYHTIVAADVAYGLSETIWGYMSGYNVQR